MLINPCVGSGKIRPLRESVTVRGSCSEFPVWAAASWRLPALPWGIRAAEKGRETFYKHKKGHTPHHAFQTSRHFLQTWSVGETMQLQKMSPRTGPQHLLPCTVSASSAQKHLPRHGTTRARPGQEQPGTPRPAERGTGTWVQTDPASQGRAVLEGRDHFACPKPPHRDPGEAGCPLRRRRSGCSHHPGRRRTASP